MVARYRLLDAPTLSALLDANAPPPLREQALRLVNLFASEAAGRTYLLAQPDLVPNLCALLSVEAADTIGRQNTLGALQKLSLRRAPQNSMIDCGVIAWLVEVLAEYLDGMEREHGGDTSADAGAADLPGHAPYWRAFDRESECREHCDRHAGCAGYSFRLAFATHVDYHRCWLIGRPSAARGRKHALIASALCRVSQLG